MSGSRSATVAPAVEILQVVELWNHLVEMKSRRVVRDGSEQTVCSQCHTPNSSMRRVRLLRLWFISLESENEQTINKRNNKTVQRVNSRGETSSLLSKMPPALEREVKHIIES